MMKQPALILFFIISLPLFSVCQEKEPTDTLVYSAKVKLVKAGNLPPHCGGFAFALSQKFVVIESSFIALKPNSSLDLIKSCPEFLGLSYFITGRIYNVKIAKTSGSPFSYTIAPFSKKENPLTFWIREIKPVNDSKTGQDNPK